MTTETGTPTRQLLRRPHEGPIAGVCAGIADHFQVDPTLVRIGAVVLAFMGPGIPAYLVAWVFLPAAGQRSIAASAAPLGSRWDRSAQAVGITLLLIAVSILWGDWWSPAPRWFLPIGLVGLGVWLLVRRDREDDPSLPGIATDPPSWRSPAGTATAPVPPHADVASETGGDDTAVGETGEAEGPVSSLAPPGTVADGAAPPDDPTTIIASLDPPPPSPVGWRRRAVAPIVFGALLVWFGIAWLADVDAETALAVGLCIIGVGFVIGAFFGGTWGLVVPALLVGGALLVTSVVNIPLHGGIGERTWDPRTLDEVRDRYELAIGEGTLDLSRISIPLGDEVEVDAQVGLGHLIVLVPDDVHLEVRGQVGGGEADLLGRTDDGMNVDLERSIEGDGTAGTLVLDLQVGFGELDVQDRSPVGPDREPALR